MDNYDSIMDGWMDGWMDDILRYTNVVSEIGWRDQWTIMILKWMDGWDGWMDR